MKYLVLLVIIVSTFWYNADYLMQHKPLWFLKAVSYVPFMSKPVSLDFDEDLKTLSEADIKQRFDNLLLSCLHEKIDLGDRACMAYISAFNGIKAKQIVFFFDNDRFNTLKVSFPMDQHENLADYLDSISRYRKTIPASAGNNGQDLEAWVVGSGLVAATRERPITGDETILNWNSSSKLLRRALMSR